MIDEDFEKVMDILQNEFGWDWTPTPDEKKITAQIINDTIKAVRKLDKAHVIKSACPRCGEKLIEKMSGIKCSKCEYWFCY